MDERKITVEQIRNWQAGVPLLAVTAYDYPMARHLDEAGVEILHVGDSLGMVVLGMEDTTEVTMADMIRATEAVGRVRPRALITADLSYRAYESVETALENSRALMKAGAEAVKMEGGREILPQIEAVLAEGIPVQGHLGMLPQFIREEGGYRKKGKTPAEAERILNDAVALQEAGVFSIILESVKADVAEKVTQVLQVPTIGIASGRGTTGQIQVITDVLGTTPWFDFPHVTPEADGRGFILQAIAKLRERLSR